MYQLTVSENQLKIINTALEEYFRIGMNQWGELADRISSMGVDMSPDNPNHNKIFDSYIAKRDDVRVVLESAGRMLWPYGLSKNSEDVLNARDIWAVFRHQLWIESGEKNDWCCDAAPVFKMGTEPLPKIKREKKDG